jgi:two-component system sensor histidine kinase GlrK
LNAQPTIAPPRGSLFRKIIGWLIVIILFMVGASIIILQMLKTAYSSQAAEFRIIPLAQYAERLFVSEHDAAKKYFETRDSFTDQTLSLIAREFGQQLDSLRTVIDREEVRLLADRAISQHRRYWDYLGRQRSLIAKDYSYDATAALQRVAPLGDSIHQTLQSITEAYLPALSKSLGKMPERTSDAMSGAYIILALALAIALAIAIMFGRTVTKPLEALMAGTEKVGEGHYETVLVTSNDELADLTRAFNLMSEKLRQLDEMRMQMMSEISHEMRTPLQVIKAGCYSIMHAKNGPELTDRQKDAVGMIHQSTNRINQFVNLFLDVAKMEAGLMKFKFEESNLHDLLNPLVQEAQLIAQSRQIKVGFTAEEVPPLMLDKERMTQVFSNLLSNALKFTPDNGTIDVLLVREAVCGEANKNGKGCVRIEVKDSGVGIPEADLNKLFSKFFQAKNTSLTNEKGSGLGLALVKHVSEAHGGGVRVESEVGVGSKFSVILPL